ncbi:MAG TPA: hypothetical protein VGK54_02980 [Chloroflexota bacterium]
MRSFWSNVTPSLPEYAEVAQSFVRYDYDSARARQEIQALGYSAGPDGMLRDSAGTPLSVQIQSIALPDINNRTLLTVADSWQRVGVAVEPDIVPPQRASDPAYRSNYPGFQLLRYPSDIFANAAGGFHSLAARLPDNNYIARGPGGGINWSRYANPDMDALVDRFLATIPRRDRLQVAGQMLHLSTEQLVVLPLFWDPSLSLASNRVKNVNPMGDGVPWNVEEWQVTK